MTNLLIAMRQGNNEEKTLALKFIEDLENIVDKSYNDDLPNSSNLLNTLDDFNKKLIIITKFQKDNKITEKWDTGVAAYIQRNPEQLMILLTSIGLTIVAESFIHSSLGF